ncbi:winged helix-turn-helix transcriptional regulator, partial [Klebsiella pneumoniae]
MNAIDALDQRILDVLLTDSRISLKQLAEQVGLSSPSVSERLRRLEERGVIRNYTVDIDPAALGYTLQAIVR